MSNEGIKVSVVLPTFNRASLLPRAIASVLSQSLREIELIVVDDASTDETPEVLREWRAKDARVRVVRNETNNYPDISKTLNRGLREAQGEYIARLDDDDYWCHSDKLRLQYEFFQSHPEYVVVGGGMIIVDAQDKELHRYKKPEQDAAIRAHALFANPFSHTTVMFDKRVALELGGYGAWRYTEDWDLWLRMGQKGKLYNFPDYFTRYLLAGQNKTFVHQRATSRMVLQMIALHRRAYPGFLLAYLLNTSQYVYSFLPMKFRAVVQPTLSYIKRRFF